MARKTKSKNPLTVVGRHGRFPFQTGMVTASLLRRGLPMTEAVEVARAVRDAVDSKSEISTEKLTIRILAQVERRLGTDVAARIKAAREREDTVPMVETARGRVPFSAGDMMRLLETAGLRLDEAIAFVGDIDRWMRGFPDGSLTEDRVHDEVVRNLHATHGESCARRYRLITWVRRSKSPLVILIGGATGTGKSTLAMELAYRLGVVWVTNTDLIRETMRTVLSAEIVPGLHDHSFRGMFVGGQVLSDPRERVLAGFHQQAAQVGVGVRAVIRRAIVENTHIIIEGTHLTPPFRQYMPEGTDAHVAAFLLAVPNEVRHRKRFPQRAVEEPRRAASTYLEAFQSVRWIHEDLLRMAEDEEAVVLPNDKLGKTLTGAVDFLSRELPLTPAHRAPPEHSVPPRSPEIPTLFLILDGLADEPCEALGGKTPLEAAAKPTLRRLAGTGGQGQISTSDVEGHAPSTNEGLLGLLGAPSDIDPIGRGLFEALGRGVSIPPGAILLRGNLATVTADGHVVDRRAGRIREGATELLASLSQLSLGDGISARVLPGHEHRVVVVLTGANLSTAVSDTDPGEEATVQRVLPVRPLDGTPEAARTAHALRKLLDVAGAALEEHPVNEERRRRGLSPANAILTRGAAAAPSTEPHRADRDGAMVSGCNTALGVARYLGLKTVTAPGMTGNLDTDLGAKLTAAGELLGDHELVMVHVKGTDIAAHDRRPLVKRDFISEVDAALGRFLAAQPGLDGRLRVVVSADHGTSSVTGNHMPGPVPLLITTWRADSTEEQDFDEETAARGALGVLHPGELTRLLGFDPIT